MGFKYEGYTNDAVMWVTLVRRLLAGERVYAAVGAFEAGVALVAWPLRVLFAPALVTICPGSPQSQT